MNAHAAPSYRQRPTTLSAAACCAALILTLPPVATAAGGDPARRKPAIEGELPAKSRFVLATAYPVALDRLTTVEGCASLFTALGADGLEQLSGAVFYQASAEQEERICRRWRAGAFTEVGGTRIGLCARFADFSRWEAAVKLIHEALHNAGMTEKPTDPAALTSGEINRLVQASCQL